LSSPRSAPLAALANFLIPARHREFILGDLAEAYVTRVAERGRLRAAASYAKDLLMSAVALRMPRGLGEPDPTGKPGRWSTGIAGVLNDARHAARSLRRRPGFSATVAVTLALGMGPAAAVFGMVNQLILRPLPGVANSRTAAYLRFEGPDRSEGLTQVDFDEFRRRATLVDGIASYGSVRLTVTVAGSRPFSVSGTTISGDYFAVLGVRPTEGRLLSAADTDIDSDPLVAVISGSLRERLFESEEAVVGQTLMMNGQPVAIVGVAGGGFRGAQRGATTEIWLPHGALVPLVGFPRERLMSRQSAMHNELLVLPRDGTDVQAVEVHVAGVLAGMAEEIPESVEQLTRIRPMAHQGLHTPPLVREVTNSTLRMMGWAVLLLLAIACANVANLLLFRNLARRGSLATRRALGASTGQLARQQLVESLLLGLLGGVAAVGVAWLIALLVRGERLVRMPAFEGFTFSWVTMGFVAASAALTVLVFGALPAALAGRFDLGDALRATRARETGRVGSIRVALATGQVGLTLALLVGGLLMVRTMLNLNAVQTGLVVEDVLWVPVDPPRGLDPGELHARQRALLGEIEAVPGVEHAALDLYGPHGSRMLGRIAPPGTENAPAGPPGSEPPEGPRTLMWEVTPGWFDLFEVAAISGRTFVDSDWRVPAGDGVVLTASLARRLFGSTDVAGRVVAAGPRDLVARRVLGVVGDYTSLTNPSQATDAFFVPYGELTLPQMSIFVKVRAGDRDAPTRVREILETAFPDVPVTDLMPLTDRVRALRSEQRMLGLLIWALAGFALLLSAVGLYGVIFFIVSQRKKEFGIRLALGADAARILRHVARSAFTIVAAGSTVGVIAAYGLARVLQGRLFGVGSVDAASYVGAAGLLGLAAVMACLAPARAAIGVDPVDTLREE